jgi:hypothetical protein
MPDILDGDGLTVKTRSEIVNDLGAAMQGIYGADINIDQNSPDGEWIGIMAQAAVDIRELLVGIYNSFNPDRALGVPLDERVVINNISRRGGTFTVQPVSITVDRTVTLQGLDANYNDVNATGYTVQDDAGNQFILVDSDTIATGTHSLNFRSKILGQVETTVGTITNPVTVVLGVTGINNPSGALEIGQNEETDAELRLRRQYSVAIASDGYLNGLLAAVLNLDGVSDAALYENVTNVVDAYGIPAHGIWLVVEGGANTDIAQLIYTKKSYGADMRGQVEVEITTASGNILVVKFDRPTAKDLYIRFDIQPTIAGTVFDILGIKQYIVDNLSYGIGEFANTSNITALAIAAIASTSGGGVPLNVEISDDGSSWTDFLEVDTLDEQWTVDTSRITITEL